jgi:hypothetical protein
MLNACANSNSSHHRDQRRRKAASVVSCKFMISASLQQENTLVPLVDRPQETLMLLSHNPDIHQHLKSCFPSLEDYRAFETRVLCAPRQTSSDAMWLGLVKGVLGNGGSISVWMQFKLMVGYEENDKVQPKDWRLGLWSVREE